MKKKGQVEVVKAIVGILLGAIIIFGAYLVAQKAINAWIGDGDNLEKIAKSNFEALTERVNWLLEERDDFVTTTLIYNLPDGYTVRGYSSSYPQYDLEKPLDCGMAEACLCLFLEKDTKVINCVPFAGKVIFLADINLSSSGVPLVISEKVWDNGQYYLLFWEGSNLKTRLLYLEKSNNKKIPFIYLALNSPELQRRKFSFKNAAQNILYEAQSKEMLGSWSEALVKYQTIIRDYPASPQVEEALYRSAEIYYLLDKFDEAASAYENFIANYPQNKAVTDASWKLAAIYNRQKNYEKAAAAYENFLNSGSTDSAKISEAQYEVGKIYELLGKKSEALEAYLRIIKNPVHTYYNSAEVSFYRIMLSIDNQTGVYFANQQYDQAIIILNSVIAEYQQKTDLEFKTLVAASYDGLGSAYRLKGDYTKAAESYEKAASYTETYYTLSSQYALGKLFKYSLRDYTKAEETYQKIIDTNSSGGYNQLIGKASKSPRTWEKVSQSDIDYWVKLTKEEISLPK